MLISSIIIFCMLINDEIRKNRTHFEEREIQYANKKASCQILVKKLSYIIFFPAQVVFLVCDRIFVLLYSETSSNARCYQLDS